MAKRTLKHATSSLRAKVANEAASLLYFGLEKEYKQAKLKAAENLGFHFLPSNLEVALALNVIAQEAEGAARTHRLIQMRAEALAIMKILAAYHPILIGSTWRGTIRRGSDIDIEAFGDSPERVVQALRSAGFKIQRTAQISTTEHGKAQTALHVYSESKSKNQVEVVVRQAESARKRRTCDTFGDEIKGLTIQQLEKLLGENPSQQFLPE